MIAFRIYEHEDKGACEPNLALCSESRVEKSSSILYSNEE